MTTGYPRDDATAAELHRLAEEYRQAALVVALANGAGRPGAPLLLIALHAAELYLDASLLLSGRAPGELREMGHDLVKRMDLAANGGLRLKAAVRRSLQILWRQRGYVRSRYDGTCVVPDWQRNRVDAMLKELADKVAGQLMGSTPLERKAA